MELLECRLSRSVLLVLEPEGGKKDRFVDKFRAAKKRLGKEEVIMLILILDLNPPPPLFLSLSLLAHTRRSGADSVRQSLDMTANSNQIPTTANDKHHLEIDELMLSEVSFVFHKWL